MVGHVECLPSEALKHYYSMLRDKHITELSDGDVDLMLKIIVGTWDPCEAPAHRKPIIKEKEGEVKAR